MTVSACDFDPRPCGLQAHYCFLHVFFDAFVNIPFVFKYLGAFKLYLGFNYDKCFFLKFLFSIIGPEVDVPSSKIDPATSSPVRSLKVAFRCFLNIIIRRLLLFFFFCAFSFSVLIFFFPLCLSKPCYVSGKVSYVFLRQNWKSFQQFQVVFAH